MTIPRKPLSSEEKDRYSTINKENIEFIMERNNAINRWVIGDMLRRTSYHYPDKEALVFGDMSRTYLELEQECNQVANALSDLGVKKYDRVAILAHNTHHHVLTWMGCAKIGAIYLAVNYLLGGEDIAYCINHSESTVFVVEDSLYPQVKDVLDRMPTVKKLIWSNQGSKQGAEPGFLDFDKWYQVYPTTAPNVVFLLRTRFK